CKVQGLFTKAATLMPIEMRGELPLESKREYTFEHADSTFVTTKVRRISRITRIQAKYDSRVSRRLTA
ncbi:MAG TPA: hypothetical protein VHV32_07470, partial [Candidatus Angelobacter sp.]|nr:hypothetical protein [Candidatus Angelobacter sp.]